MTNELSNVSQAWHPSSTPGINKIIFWIIFSICVMVFYVGFTALIPFWGALVVACIFNPVVDRLIKRGFTREKACMIVSGGIYTVIIACAIYIAPKIYEEIFNIHKALESGHAPALFDAFYEKLPSYIKENTKNIKSALEGAQDNLLDIFMKVISTIMFSTGLTFKILLLSPFIAFYFLRDSTSVIHSTINFMPLAYRAYTVNLLTTLRSSFVGFLRVEGIVISIWSIYYSIAFSLIVQIHAGITMGLLTGVMIFIPYLGVIISFIVSLTVTFLEFGVSYHILSLLIVFGIAQIMDAMIICPKIIANKLGIHPLLVLLSLLLGWELCGILGVFLALPTAVFCRAIVISIIRHRHDVKELRENG